jgi:hypothetical protein
MSYHFQLDVPGTADGLTKFTEAEDWKPPFIPATLLAASLVASCSARGHAIAFISVGLGLQVSALAGDGAEKIGSRGMAGAPPSARTEPDAIAPAIGSEQARPHTPRIVVEGAQEMVASWSSPPVATGGVGVADQSTDTEGGRSARSPRTVLGGAPCPQGAAGIPPAPCSCSCSCSCGTARPSIHTAAARAPVLMAPAVVGGVARQESWEAVPSWNATPGREGSAATSIDIVGGPTGAGGFCWNSNCK